jgi:hypothetical protein
MYRFIVQFFNCKNAVPAGDISTQLHNRSVENDANQAKPIRALGVRAAIDVNLFFMSLDENSFVRFGLGLSQVIPPAPVAITIPIPVPILV